MSGDSTPVGSTPPQEVLGSVGFVMLLPTVLQPLVCALFRPMRYDQGEVIIAEGSEGDAIYVLAAGSVRVTKADGDRTVELELRHPPAVFGEVALLTGEPRMATVRAITPIEVLRLGRDGFDALLQVHPEVADALESHVRLSRINSLLRGHPAFSMLPLRVLSEALDWFVPIELAKGAVLADDTDALYIVERGRLELSAGERTSQLTPGDFFGEGAALSGASRSERARAIDASRLFRLDVIAFSELVSRDVDFGRAIADRARLRDREDAERSPEPVASPAASPVPAVAARLQPVRIDQSHRAEAVAEIIDSEFFAELSARAEQLRKKVRS